MLTLLTILTIKYNADIIYKTRVTETCSTNNAYTANNTNTNNYMEYWHYDRHFTNFFLTIFLVLHYMPYKN